MSDGLAHEADLDGEAASYCVECGARHSVGPDLEPEERGCMCGGDLKLVSAMDLGELEEYAFEWGKAQ